MCPPSSAMLTWPQEQVAMVRCSVTQDASLMVNGLRCVSAVSAATRIRGGSRNPPFRPGTSDARRLGRIVPTEVHGPVDFPCGAPVRRERLLPAKLVDADLRPYETDGDGDAVQLVRCEKRPHR